MEAMQFTAGSLRMTFEPATTYLRHVCLGDTEVLRGIYVAVRDSAWGTVKPTLSNLKITDTSEQLQLSFDVRCQQGDIDFCWQGFITLCSAGTIRYRMQGRALTTFQRNRIGFCILHPIVECAGQRCTVTTASGETVESRFPNTVAPHQPFKNIRRIRHQVGEDVWAQVSMTGDVFEMEDQRNWTDASFKTYCTPLELPSPVTVEQGTELEQEVVLELLGNGRERRSKLRDVVEIAWSAAEPWPLPSLGLEFSGDHIHLPHELRALQDLNMDYYRLDVHLRHQSWYERLANSLHAAEQLRTKLQLALFLSDASQLDAFATAMAGHGHKVGSWLVFHPQIAVTPVSLVEAVRGQLQTIADVAIGGGTNLNFTELNRSRPAAGAFDCLCYSMNPQVHAFDDLSLVETLAAQGHTVRTARTFGGDTPIVVSPVTLRPRFAAGSTVDLAEKAPAAKRADERQGSPLAAVWTLGSIKYLSEAGVTAITYFETVGPCGILGYPVASVFELLQDYRQASVIPCQSSEPLNVDALVLEKDGVQTTMVFNLSKHSQEVVLPDRTRVTLDPYQIAVKTLDQRG